MNIGDIFNVIFLIPIINLLVGIYQGLSALHLPGALGWALIILTVFIRLAIWPLMTSQIKSTKKMAELKPHLDELKRKHGSDKQALAQAQMALYRQHGVNPAGGCLPALIQIPLFYGLYQSIINLLPGFPNASLNWINSILYFPWMHLSQFPDPNFFGLNLGIKPYEFGKYGLLIILVPIITAALTFIQSKMMMPKAIPHHQDEPPKETKEKEKMEDTMSAVQSQMVFLMPIMIGYFAFTFPVGLAIYWNTYTVLGIIQQHRLTGWGGLLDFVKKWRRQ